MAEKERKPKRLKNTLNRNPRNPDAFVPNSQVGFVFDQVICPIPLRSKLEIQVQVKNLGGEPIKQNSVLIIEGGDFYYPCKIRLQKEIPQQRQETFLIKLEYFGGATIKTLPDIVTVSLEDPNQTQYFSDYSGFEIDLPNMIGDIVDWKPADPSIDRANILVFGPIGVGKSTLINFGLSLWEETYQEFAIALNHTDHVTMRSHFHWKDGIPFQFLDTKGLTHDNYNQNEFEDIIKGLHSTVFQENSNSSGIEVKIAEGIQQSADKIHTAIFVLSQAWRTLVGFDAEKVRRFKDKFVIKAHQMELRPILVVTRMDETTDSEEEVLKDFHEMTGISEPDIFLVRNKSLEEKDKENDKVLYQILSKVLENAQLGFLTTGEDITIVKNLITDEVITRISNLSVATISEFRKKMAGLGFRKIKIYDFQTKREIPEGREPKILLTKIMVDSVVRVTIE